MKRGPGRAAANGAGSGLGDGAGGAADSGDPNAGQLRPPLSGGFGPEGAAPDSPSNTSMPLGLLASGGGGGAAARDAAYMMTGFLRAPSDSPATSQISVTSSYMGPGPGSTVHQRYAPTQAGGAGLGAGANANPSAIGLRSGQAQALQPEQQPQGGQLGPHASRLPPGAVGGAGAGAGAGGSSGQQDMFLDEGSRMTPPYGAGSSTMPTVLMHTQQSQLLASNHSGMGLLAAGDRPSHVSSRALSGAHAQPSSNLVTLHKAVERLMLQDSELYAKVQASMKGISSLAKETNKLEFCRDASGATVINQYVVVKTLGRGAFGKVKLCLNTLDGQLYAVKMINRAHLLRQLQKPARPLRRRAPPPRNTSDTGLMNLHLQRTQTDGNLSISHTNAGPTPAQAAAPARASMDDTSPLAAIMREIAVMKKVDHPHVVRLHEVIDPPGSSYLMMVMEYCEGGCVMETRSQTGLVPLGEERARECFRQACMGLDYLHYNNVVHGDLKPENMLVSGSGQLKIADFGSSRFMGGDPTDATKTSCTPAFQSPEEIGHMPVDPYAADLWALGCCLYCFVFGRLPFVGSCVVDIYRSILTRPHTYPAGVVCSDSLRNLIDRMLNKDPRKRLRLREVGEHEWVTAGGSLPPVPCLHSLAVACNAGGGGEAPPPIIHVTHAEQVNAIDRSSLVSLIRARLKEKTCQPGEYLFKEGEEAHCVYMIMTGVVELTQHLRRAGHSLHPHHPHHHPHGPEFARVSGGHATGGSAGGGGSGTGTGTPPEGGSAGYLPGCIDHDASFSVDLDESLTLDHPEGAHITEAMNIVDGKLHIDRQQAIEMRRRMQGNLLGDNAEYVVEVKGPGSVIGEIGMDTATATHRVSARARGPVTVVKLTEENFFKALLALYGGNGGGGSAASTTLTASSVSEAVGRGGTGAGAAAVVAAAAAGAATPGLSAQHLMVMQYLEDSGSFATYHAPPSATGGRLSLDTPLGTLHANRAGPSAAHIHVAAGPSGRSGPSGAAAKAKAALMAAEDQDGAPAAAGGVAAVTAAGQAGAKMSGAHSMLGVLNTIHSINASRAGGNTSEEGVADL
ncbi:hypothetical protein GPECTOR_19g386 [Gonium pectorale]|uniref:cGMP-dependent protein kinase n=1 Tax=Gonium pectorale TaxID=33097 RepID=A0A150GJS2_GONPE|nr:hypothetical protein GPECTOR_19g386 [Gonium pectorale]|eukprot:KXZ49935.1 hypothetical protein GPECTOR_19g386 [Gonium pectorale]